MRRGDSMDWRKPWGFSSESSARSKAEPKPPASTSIPCTTTTENIQLNFEASTGQHSIPKSSHSLSFQTMCHAIRCLNVMFSDIYALCHPLVSVRLGFHVGKRDVHAIGREGKIDFPYDSEDALHKVGKWRKRHKILGDSKGNTKRTKTMKRKPGKRKAKGTREIGITTKPRNSFSL